MDLQFGNLVGPPHSNRLLQRVGPEAAAGRDVPVNCLWLRPCGDDLDPDPECRAIRLTTDELERQRAAGMARILKQGVVKLVTERRPAELDENIDVAVAVPVAAGDAVAFLQMSRPGSAGHLGESLTGDVLEHPLRNEKLVSR